jgi:hypothetical protein
MANKYVTHQVAKPKPPKPAEHPAWRGIGCLMIVLVPVISFALAVIGVDIGIKNGWPIPYEWTGQPRFPDWVWNVSTLRSMAAPLLKWKNMWADLIFAVVMLIPVGGIVSLGYAIMYRILNPKRYGPYDAPPPKYKPKPYKR